MDQKKLAKDASMEEIDRVIREYVERVRPQRSLEEQKNGKNKDRER